MGHQQDPRIREDLAAHAGKCPVTDAEGVWFIPTNYAYTAIAYNTETVPAEDVASVQVFADPKYAGRISLPDSTDDVWSLAFMATGVTSWDNVTDEQFQAAADWLRAVHPNVRAYWADPTELSQLMASGEVQVAWSWNDTTAILRAENFPIGFNRTAKEGAATWYCGAVNVKDGPGVEDNAYDFVNSVLAHPSATAILDAVGYSSSNDAAMATIPSRDDEGRLHRPDQGHAPVRADPADVGTARPHDRGIRDDQVGLLRPDPALLKGARH